MSFRDILICKRKTNYFSNFRYGFQALAHEFAGQAIIMVSIQYRLGLFGFFSTGDTTAPGMFFSIGF